MPIYKLNGDVYDIPQEKQGEFESQFPDAFISYTAGEDQYEIPVSKKNDFLRDFPDAQPYSISTPQVQETPIEDPAPMAEVPMFDDEPNAPLGEPDAERGFGAGAREGWKGLKAGFQNLWGETANVFTGSSQDSINALNELNEMVRQGKDVAAETEDAWTDAGREIRTGAMEFLPGWMIKGWKDRVLARAEKEKVLDDIREALGEAGGDVDKARSILEQRAQEMSYGDEQITEAAEKFADVKPTEGFGAWVGSNVVQMIPSASALIVGAVTKSPAAAKAIGMIGMGGMTAATAGTSMYEARQAGATDAETWKVGITDGMIEYLTEKLPFDRYTSRIMGKVKGEVAQDLFSALRTNKATRTELEKLLVKANERLGGRLFSKKNLKDYVADMLAEGASEFSAEALQTMTSMMYENPEDYPTINEILTNGWEGAKAGFFMGAVLGGASKTMEHTQNRKRRMDKGSVDVALVDFGDGEKDVAEVVEYDASSNTAVVLHDGSFEKVSGDAIADGYRFSYEEFENARLRQMEDEAVVSGNVTEGQIQGLEDNIARDIDEIKALAPEMTESEISAVLQSEIAVEPGTPLGDAVAKYQEDVARHEELVAAKREADTAKKEAIRTEIETAVGQRFWVQESGEDDGSGIVPVSETVEEVVYADGRVGYVVGSDESGNLTMVYTDGTKGFSSRAEIAEKENSGEILSNTVMGLDDYLAVKMDIDEVTREKARMQEEHALSVDEMVATHPQGSVINVGTEEAKVEVPIIAPPTKDGVIVQMPDGTTPMLTWEDVAHAEKKEITPKTNAQLNQSIVDEYRVAYTPAAPAASQPTQQKEEQVKRTSPANPLPLKADGSVDQTALWNKDPEGWAKWNDEKRQDGGADSLAYVTNAIAIEQAKMAELQAVRSQETDFDRRDALDAEIATAQERIDRLVAIQQGYLAQPAVADAVQNVQPEPEPQTEEERAAAEEQRREPFRKRAKELGEKLGVKINIAESLADVQEEQAREEIIGAEVSGSGARFPGWYNRDTGEVTIYLPHVRGVADIDRTIIHEVVAHKGLRGLLGKEGYNVLCDAVWDMMTEAERAKYMAYPGVNGDKRLAADEYIARFAEGLDLEQSRPIWNKIAEAVQKILNSMGIRLEVTKEDLADLIAASYMRLQEQARAAQTENAPVVEVVTEEIVPETTIEQQAETGADVEAGVEADIEEVTEESTSPIIAAAQQDKGGISFNVTTEEPLQDKIRKFAQTEEGKATGWTEDDIESIIAETESLIDAIHRSSTGNEFYDEFAYKEPTIRVDWRDGEAKPIVTWTRANIEYKYDMSADLLCINNEGLEAVLSSDKMVALMEMFVPEKKAKKGEPEIKFTSEDYLELYNTLKDLGFVVPCKGCFDAAGRFKMLPSVAQKFAAEVNALIDERNKDPKAFDEKLKAKPGEKTVGGLPATAATKSAAIAAGVAGDNLTEHVKWTQLMSADGQTKMLSDWGGIFRAWQRTGAGRPKDKLLPEPYYGDIVSSVSTIIGKYGEKTPSFRDTLVNQGTGLRRNSHSEFRPVLAIDEIQFMRDAFIRNLTVFKYMKELDDVRLFGKMGVKFNMSFFPEYVPGTKAAGLDKDGNYIASEESVGSREFPYQGEDGKRHYDGMKGWEEAQKHINKDVSLSSVIFSIPHLLKALTDVPTPSDMRGVWGSLIPFHSSGATTASLAMQGLGMARANGVGHGFSEAFYDYGKGVTNFEAVQNDRFGEGWHIVSGTKAGTDVEPGHKLEFVNGNHYYNKALGVHLFASGYILDSELPAGVLGENGELDITNDQKKALMHKFTIDYNDKVRELKGPYAYKDAADFYIAELPKLGLIPRFDFEVSEEKFLEMCEAANVDPRHPKLGWKGEGNSWSPIDSEAYYSLFCDYGMTDPATGEWAPHMPVGYVNEEGEREFRLPENAVEIVKDGLDRFSEVRRSENARIDEAIEAFAQRSVEKGRISQKSVDKVLGKKSVPTKPAKPKKSGVIDLVEEARKAVEKESGVSFRAVRTDEQREKLFDKSKEKFGLTNNFNAAGYMLPDGSLLDFSEANDGGDPNQRSLDHREIEGIIMDEGKEYDSRWMYLADFMNEGAIRLLPEYAGINLMKAPTKEQRQKLFDFIYKYNGEVILEIADERLNNVAYVEYDRRTSPSRIFRDIDRYFNEGIVPQQSGISFRAVNDNQAIFVSNAAKAVEGIKQEKATPEQWLKMIEKNGGLKAGEDKWMGLSDWLKASDKKTLTKQEVLDYINENMIVIEETHYAEGAEDDAENTYAMVERILQEKFGNYIAEYYEQNNGENDDLYGGDSYKYAMDKLREEMNDEFPYAIERTNSVVYLTFPYEETDDLQEWADKLGVTFAPQNPINDTRLNYTTDGLENKHEIALTVPTIERWGQHDDIHFGDAGEGRAVAWIRFGETEVNEEAETEYERDRKNEQDYRAEMEQKYGSLASGMRSILTEKEYAYYMHLVNRTFHSNERRKEGGKRVLVIDEIQSKRHQEGREKGYGESEAYKEAVKRKNEAKAAFTQYADYLKEKYGTSQYGGIRMDMLTAEEDAKRQELFLPLASAQADPALNEPGIPDAPFDKNWHELAMKRMLRYAAENGYDVIAWTKGEQQAERYGIGGKVDSISSTTTTYGGNPAKEIFIDFKNHAEEITLYVDANGNVVDHGEYEGRNLGEIIGKELAVKLLAEDTTLSEDGLLIGGEGMKGFYDKILPAFMNKYGKKWGVKVEDIDLPNLEEAGRVMHSVPVTEEMKASVMGGQVMFRMRTEEEDAMEFAQSAIDDCLSRYNDVAEVKVFPVNEETAERFGYTLEELKKTGGEYLEDEDLIAIFANEDYDDSAIFENIFFHESIHKIASFFTEFVEIGEWLWSNAGEVGLQAVKTHIEENYKPSQYNEEMLTFGMSLAMSIGVAGKQEKAIPQIYRSAYRKILNEIGYEPEKESRRAEERISDSSRKEVHRNERKADEGGRGKEGETRTAELSAEERRVIGEYFPEFNKGEETPMKAPNGKDSKLTKDQWNLVRSEEFIGWFGDWINDPENASKVVDPETGEPMLVYHGTVSSRFAEFNDEVRKNTKAPKGTYWFVDSKENAETYASSEKGLYQCFLNLRNPAEIDAEGGAWYELPADYEVYDGNEIDEMFDTLEEAKAFARENGIDESTIKPRGETDTNAFVQRIKDKGVNDGVIIRNVIDAGDMAEDYSAEPATEYVVFNSNQISFRATSETAREILDTYEYGSGESLVQDVENALNDGSIDSDRLRDLVSAYRKEQEEGYERGDRFVETEDYVERIVDELESIAADRPSRTFAESSSKFQDEVNRLKREFKEKYGDKDMDEWSKEDYDTYIKAIGKLVSSLSGKGGVSFRTSLELDEEFGDAWRNQQNEDGRHSTQVANTKSTYEKIGRYLEDAGMKGASILDASSGLGLGTQALREMGFQVDDVEPFPSENREAPTFSSYADIDKQYDVVISNAVLNVIPDDWRADVLHQMADAVKEGGKMIINTRPASNIAQQGVEGKTRITLDSPSEILVKRGDRIAAYQKGFTSEELAEWIKSELGEGWRVEKATKKNSGISGEGTAVVIKERGGVSFRTYEQEEFDDTNIKDALSELYDDLEFADNGIYGADDVVSWINSILANYVGKYESDLQNIIDIYEDASVEFAADFRRYGGRMIDTEERDAEVASMLSNVIAAIENEDNVSFRVTGTPTDEVVANGLNLTPAQTAEVAANIFAALPEESREKIADGLNGNILGLQDAIMQIPASLATKENWNEEDRAMADVVAEEMTKMAGEMTRPFSAPEALWLLYNNLNKGNDLISQASRALVQRNLGFDEETLERQEEAKQGVSFRMVGDATANAKASMYNRGAVNVWTRLKESFVDMQASVEELVSAIEKATGKVAKGFENILLALNQQSSKGLAAMESYEQRFLMPMFDEVRKIMDKAYAGYDTVVRYVILKHGLERNKKLAQRDAKAHYQEIYDEMIAKVNSMDDRQKRTYLTNAQLQDADAKAKLATLKAADTSAFTEEEKNAHKRELAKAKEEAKKAKENLERAQKINSMSEQELKDELDKVFEKIENGTDSVYKELRKNDYSGISSMFYHQLGVNRKDYSTEEEYQAALMLAKNDRFSSLEEVEVQAEGEVESFEGRVDTKELWKRINAATKETLRQQYEANMISKDQYESLRNMFEYYVPLRGFKDNTAEDMYTYYRKPNSTGYTKPILGAEGRKTEAESPFGWIAAMAGSAIASNVKNEAKLALYYFVSNRPNNGIATLSRTWFVHTPGDVDANGKKIFKPAYPPFSEDLSSDAAKQAYEDWQEQMRELQKQGLAYEAGQRLNLGNAVVNISDANKPEHVVTVKVAGKDYTIVINGNPRAAQAINGELNLEGTADDYSAIFGPVLRWMSSVNTSYNPEFWITNLMRDMAFTWMAVNTKEDPAYRKKFSKNYWKCFRVIGLVAKNEKGTIGNSYIEDMYKDFVKYGGVTGYTQIKDSETWEKEIDNYLRSTSPESLRNGKMMRGMKTFFHAAHRFGESLEQVSRFAAFLTSREMGKTINEAIADAKEITVNFNRKGSGKMISLEESKYLTDKNGQPLSLPARWAAVGLSSIAPLGRRTIMFFNAAVQGLNSVYRLWKKNPRRLAGWTAAYFVIGVMNAALHALLDDDDDYLDIPQYERRNSLMLGGNGAYLKWALPQEARAFYALGDLAVETVLGRNPHQNVVGEAMKIATEVLPVNPSEGWKAFVPSVAIPAVELMLNEDYKGAPIYNEQKWLSDEERKRTAKWSSAYQGTGAMYKGISQGLNYITGGDKYDAGKINLQPEKMEYIVQSAFGGTIRTADKFINTIWAMFDPEEDVTVRQTPFLNRILTLNDERFKNVHVNEVFDYYKADADHALTLEKRYTKDRDLESLNELRKSEEYQWARVYGRYKKALDNLKEKLKVAEGTAEKKELMRQQDELKRRVIKEISEL